MKLLIINPKEYEFNEYWNTKKQLKNYELIHPNSRHILFLINREFLEKDINNKEYGKELEKIIDEKLFLKSSGKVNIKEIGTISHADTGVNFDSCSEKFKNKVIFNKTYGSQDKPSPGLCVRDFNSEICHGSLPLDKLRDTVNNCKNFNFDEAFEEVWEYFLGDRVLETKLEFLHLCLTPVGAKKTYLMENFNLIENITIDNQNITDYIKANLANKSDSFENIYVDNLIKLRNVIF